MLKWKLPTLMFLILLFSQAFAAAASTLTSVPSRVISLAPNITEFVYALGAGDQLVGRTRFCTFPPEVLSVPVVGSFSHPNLEQILALRPDLCLAAQDGTPRHVIALIERIGVPVRVFDPAGLNRLAPTVLEMGAVLGREEQAGRLAARIGERLERVDRMVMQRLAHSGHHPSTLFQLQTFPLIFAGKGSFVNELIARAGGVNPLEAANIYPRLGLERVLELQPEVILTVYMGGRTGLGGPVMSQGADWGQWQSLPAVRQKRVYSVDPDIFCRPSPRSLDALEELADILHPQGAGVHIQGEPVEGSAPEPAAALDNAGAEVGS